MADPRPLDHFDDIGDILVSLGHLLSHRGPAGRPHQSTKGSQLADQIVAAGGFFAACRDITRPAP